MNKIRTKFPMADKVTYLDNSVLLLKPLEVIEAGTDYYTNFSVSPRSADSRLGVIVVQKISNVRNKVADLINGYPEEIIFTSGTTESLNIFAQMSEQFLKPNDEILLSSYNHSSNIVPWIEVAKKTQAKVIFSENILEDINPKTKVVSLSQLTNNINQHFDMDEIYQKVQENNSILVNDAAQAIVSEEVTFDNCDIIAFSSNKLYGPTGLGVLAIKKELLEFLKPTKFGGGATYKVNDGDNWQSHEGIQSYEPGTPNIAAIWQLDKAIDFYNDLTLEITQKLLKELANYLFDELIKLENVEIASQRGDSVFLFNVKNINSQDVTSYLGHKDIYVRSGTFCSPLIQQVTKRNSYIRISLAVYNNKKDIDTLIEAIKNGGDFLGFL